MEKSDSVEAHYHVVLVASFNNLVVAHRAAWLSNHCNSRLVRSLDVVSEREERVASEGDICVLGNPFFLLFVRKDFWLYLEQSLPFSVRENVVVLRPDVNVNRIVAVSALYSVYKLQSQNFRRLAEPPVVRFLSRKAGAVDAALLPGSNSNSLSVLYIADRI